MKIEEIENVISDLNEKLFEYGFEDGNVEFTLWSNSWVHGVKFLGVHLWDSDNDDRLWEEDIEDYESLKDCILRKYYEFVNKLPTELI